MKISLLQHDIIWGNPTANHEKIEEILWGLEKSDVYVLPEMFSTGFGVEPKGFAETEGQSLVWMQRMARELGGAVCGSVAIEEENGSCYNRFYFVRPNGVYESYDKRHLFSYADEHRYYTAGRERAVVEFRGMRFLLQICYDLRFPVFSRNNEKIPYDCALYVASWPITRQAVWDTLLHARAIENQCYVAGVNRVGTDKNSHYGGGTMVVDPYGNTLAACPLDEESAVTVELDLQKLKDFRRKFPVLKDADRRDVKSE